MAREFEQILMHDGIKYPCLRLIQNENDNNAFHHIINFQARSIGKATSQKIEISTKKRCSLFSYIQLDSFLSEQKNS
ncbi:unnamed protein product [Rotaria sp. Silwood1]|nr:unnamed protein product [Rotaria sp. Silwood1]CAF4882366.1 unnamed protein product [Rotaria sp. Silwood1]CAF5102068.1 unnamed protein product [Rotaria sp. Silwood1]